MYNLRINAAVSAFKEGQPKKSGNVVSTGNELYYHGNKIAEWRKNGLYISNGGYVKVDRRGNEITGSKTTKDHLNKLPGVYISQVNFRWVFRGQKWDGAWKFVKAAKKPDFIETKKAGDVFNMETQYKRIDGWRGYSEPVYAIAGFNDTGTWSDSPCPSDIGQNEKDNLLRALSAAGIKTKIVTLETSNVFCVHHYIIAKVKDHAKGLQIVEAFLKENETRLLYAVKNVA